jgi:hypothetical protein
MDLNLMSDSDENPNTGFLPDIDTEARTDINTPPDPANPVVVEDPNGNAGDADAAGDRSACMEDKFIEYDCIEDHAVHPGTKDSQTQLTFPIKSKSSKPTVLGMPIEDLICVCLLWQLCTTYI